MRLPMKWLCFIVLTLFATQSNATDTFKKLSLEHQQRANSLYEIVRCPVCEGQSLAGSESTIAKDLRRVIDIKIQKNISDTRIKSELVAMYGQDILFEPPVNAHTFLLNYGAYGALVIIFLIFLYRHRTKNTI
jgi:cytochrome c-type biogenesis protein CcmH